MKNRINQYLGNQSLSNLNCLSQIFLQWAASENIENLFGTKFIKKYDLLSKYGVYESTWFTSVQLSENKI